MIFPEGQGWFEEPSIDLTGVKQVLVSMSAREASESPVEVEVRLDSIGGKLLGSSSVKLPPPAAPPAPPFAPTKIALQPVTDGQMHRLYFIVKLKEKIAGGIRSVEFRYKKLRSISSV